jgi:hypothetical protein
MYALIVSMLTGATVFGPTFVGGRDQVPPRPFTGNATLPGKIVADRKTLSGSWVFSYLQKDATMESGDQGPLHSSIFINFREDGTYSLHYSATWGFRLGGRGLPLPNIGGMPPLRDGVNVREEGRYSLSDEILLLEPNETFHTQIEDNRIVKSQQPIASENRALLLRIDGKKLHMAGRCAAWQVEPVCREARDVWFQYTAQLGRRWVGMQPR